MSKLIIKNPYYENKEFDSCDKPWLIKVSSKIWMLVEKYSCDLSSEIFDMYISDVQYKYLTSQRAKNFWVTTWLPKCIVKDILDNLDCINAYAFCLHDCDTYEDGSSKKNHIHILVQFTTNYAFSKIACEFHTVDFRRVGDNWYHEFHYLTHDSDKCLKEGKYKYSYDSIVSNDLKYMESKAILKSKDFTDSDIIKDILDNKSTRFLIEKYDKAFSRNQKNLYELCERIRKEEHIPRLKRIESCIDLGNQFVLCKFNDGSSDVLFKEKLLKGNFIYDDKEN